MGTIKWHIGCSGFHYREWKEVFYPAGLAQRKWFAYYSSQFDTVELNVTFYRFPTLSSLQKWYDTSPGNFRFSVKAPQQITHYKQFNECETLLADFYGTLREGLKEKLGPVLFQLTPRLHYSADRLEQVAGSLDKDFTNVIEFRHKSWWRQDVITELAKSNIIFCGISYPLLPEDVIVNNAVAYYRFHGIPRLYYSKYNEIILKKVTDELLQQKVKEVYVYFNNTAAAGAIENAVWLKEYINGKI